MAGNEVDRFDEIRNAIATELRCIADSAALIAGSGVCGVGAGDPDGEDIDGDDANAFEVGEKYRRGGQMGLR